MICGKCENEATGLNLIRSEVGRLWLFTCDACDLTVQTVYDVDYHRVSTEAHFQKTEQELRQKRWFNREVAAQFSRLVFDWRQSQKKETLTRGST